MKRTIGSLDSGRQTPYALGLIPARGGSKGVPRKNIRLLCDKPLIAYSIEAARSSRLLTDCVVSTDDAEIARISSEWGGRVLQRPPELATDQADVALAAQHAITSLESESGQACEILVLLQPTAPVRTGQDIDAAISILIDDPEADSVVSVYQVSDAHPARMYRLDDEGRMQPLWPEWQTSRRQSLPAVYHRNGAIYAVRRSVLMDQGSLLVAALRRTSCRQNPL